MDHRRGTLQELSPGPTATLILSNNDLRGQRSCRRKGADIYALADRRTGVDVLFKSPWGTRSPGPWLRAASSMERWVEAYPGGWQVLLPNGGDECVEQGVTWGYHGEAALVPWTVTGTGGHLGDTGDPAVHGATADASASSPWMARSCGWPRRSPTSRPRTSR